MCLFGVWSAVTHLAHPPAPPLLLFWLPQLLSLLLQRAERTRMAANVIIDDNLSNFGNSQLTLGASYFCLAVAATRARLSLKSPAEEQGAAQAW